MHRAMRTEFGDIVRIPGFLGRADTLITFKPTIFEKVFRTESLYPRRRGLETFIYYRKNVRPEVFGDTGGLLSEHGEKWLDVRSKVNPVMLQPRTVKMYIDKVDQVVFDFIDKMRLMRDSNTYEMSNNFGHELNRWALESIGVIALDERLGVLNDDNHEHGQRIINVSSNSYKNVRIGHLINPSYSTVSFLLVLYVICWLTVRKKYFCIVLRVGCGIIDMEIL